MTEPEHFAKYKDTLILMFIILVQHFSQVNQLHLKRANLQPKRV